MIAHLADLMVENQLLHKRISDADKAIYRYGYILMMETMINILISVLVGILFQVLAEVLWFLMIFVPLRSYAGGYHMNRAWKCIVVTNAMIAGITLTAGYLIHTVSPFLCLGMEILGGVIICVLAPVDTEAKPLDEGEKKIYRRKTWLICAGEALLDAAMLFLGMESLACVGIMAHMALVMSLALEKWNQRQKRIQG